MTLIIIAQAAGIYFLNEENKTLTIVNERLALITTPIPKAIYVFGCSKPSAAVVVLGNGNSYPLEWKQLKKLKQLFPKNIPIISFQDPECKSSET